MKTKSMKLTPVGSWVIALVAHKRKNNPVMPESMRSLSIDMWCKLRAKSEGEA